MLKADIEHDLSCLGVPSWKYIFREADKRLIIKGLNGKGLPYYKITNYYLANYMFIV